MPPREPAPKYGHMRAELLTMRSVMSRAYALWPEIAARYATAELTSRDLIAEPAIALAALRTPTRHWYVASGRLRPQGFRPIAWIRFHIAVRHTKAEILRTIDARLASLYRPR